MSNLHTQLTASTDSSSKLQANLTALELSREKAEQAANASQTELSDLKANLEKASEKADKEGSSRSSAETKIAQLEAEVGAANRKAESARSRAELLEKKVETLTTLHRESDARSQARQREHQRLEREAGELKTRVTGLSNENARLREAEQRRRKTELSSIDDAGVQELVDEERDRLAARVRSLEGENLELRRGVWRDRRRDLQPSLDDGQAPASAQHHSPGGGFDEVDLVGGGAAADRAASAAVTPTARISSSFQDVINSGISAFTGLPVRARAESAATNAKALAQPRGRVGSLDSLEELDFDEDAFRLAQEEEGRRRIERVKEVKRGLGKWKGWRVDIVDVRAGLGGGFEI